MFVDFRRFSLIFVDKKTRENQRKSKKIEENHRKSTKIERNSTRINENQGCRYGFPLIFVDFHLIFVDIR